MRRLALAAPQHYQLVPWFVEARVRVRVRANNIIAKGDEFWKVMGINKHVGNGSSMAACGSESERVRGLRHRVPNSLLYQY